MHYWYQEDYDIPLTGLVYCGAHIGHKLGEFSRAGFRSILAIEPNPDDFVKLEKFSSDVVECVNAAVWHENGTASYLMIDGFPKLNSLFLPNEDFWVARHGKEVKDIPVREVQVPCVTLDTLLAARGHRYNFLYMNIQGGELSALQGAPNSLRGIDIIETEVNLLPRYDGGAVLGDLEKFLARNEFRRIEYSEKTEHGLGQATYINGRLKRRQVDLQNLRHEG